MAKVVIIGPAHPLRGGLSSFNQRLAQEFMNEGHEAIIYTFSLQYPSFLFPGKTQLSEDPAPEGLDIRVKINSIHPLNWMKVGNEIRKLEPDLVVFRYWLPFMGPCLGTIARKIRKNKKSRLVVIADNIIPHEKRPGDTAFTRYFLKPIHGVLTMSQSVMNDLSKFDTVKPRLVSPHPLYDNFGSSMPREEALKSLNLDPAFRYLLFFGFIRPYKGLDIMIDAFSDARLRNLPLKLIVAGEYYTDAKPYQEQIDKSPAKDFIIQKNDFIPDSQVRNYFCASDLVIQPYKTATQSGVTQIAYHFNIPMIVTNVSGLPENVPDGKVGFVTEVNATSVADKILEFYASDKSEAFRKNMEEEKKKYSWSVLVERLFTVGRKEGEK